MHANTFDRYEARESLIHRLDPRVKVVVTVLFIVSNALLPDGAWLAFLLAWGVVVLANIQAGLGISYSFKRSFIALPFALPALALIFTVPGQSVFTLPLGPWQLTATDAGFIRCASIVARSWLSVQVAILLVATTQFPDLMHALRHLRVPPLITAVVSFTYRYLFVLVDEVMRLLRARESRSARLPGYRSGGSIPWRARVAGHMAGQLFIRSYERSDRVYSAMLARGYDGQFLTLNPHRMRPHDWLFCLAAGMILLIVQIIAQV
ncbi:MAG: cobalt ECF transporter T component CbiQ [Anaerolineales bacterium]|nr:cobalt ECF transporter T component CbiQ [Anaerolineales bacterium]